MEEQFKCYETCIVSKELVDKLGYSSCSEDRTMPVSEACMNKLAFMVMYNDGQASCYNAISSKARFEEEFPEGG